MILFYSILFVLMILQTWSIFHYIFWLVSHLFKWIISKSMRFVFCITGSDILWKILFIFKTFIEWKKLNIYFKSEPQKPHFVISLTGILKPLRFTGSGFSSLYQIAVSSRSDCQLHQELWNPGLPLLLVVSVSLLLVIYLYLLLRFLFKSFIKQFFLDLSKKSRIHFWKSPTTKGMGFVFTDFNS